MRRRLPAVLLAAAVVAAGCSGDDGAADATTTSVAPGPTTTAPAGTPTPLQEVTAGQCFDEVGDETAQPFVVAVRPCADPHVFEVYARLTFQSAVPSGKGAAYPGDLAVANQAEDQCAGQFEAFMGLTWEASDYDIRTWWPMQQAWEKGDRTVLCATYRVTGGTTVGSVRGTQQ